MRRWLVLTAVCGLAAQGVHAAPPAAPVPRKPDALYQPLPAKTTASNSLAVVVHGYLSGPSHENYTNLQADMQAKLGSSWDVWNFDWHQNANYDGNLWSDAQESMAEIHGQELAKSILNQVSITGGYTRVHLLGLSMGSRVVDQASKVLRQAAPNMQIQLTFFDAWAPHGTQMTYGKSATWADHYIYKGDTFGNIPNWSPNSDRPFANARNFDVTDYSKTNPSYGGHSGPIVWYDKTVDAYNAGTPRDFGFDLSLGVNAPGWGQSPASRWEKQKQVTLKYNGTTLSVDPVAGSGKTYLQNIDPQLTYKAKGGTASVASTGIQLNSTNSTAGWVELTVTAPVSGINCLDFRFEFLSGGDYGMLSAYIDNKLVTMQQKGYALGGKQWAYDLILDPQDNSSLLTGTHTLAFRLDSMYASGNASVWIGDIGLSQLHVPEPATLSVMLLLTGLGLARPRRLRRD